MSNPIIGKTITAMEIADDRQALHFIFTDGDIIVDVEGECCSYTWIEHIELPALGFPAIVLAVDDLEMPEGKPSSFHTDPEELKFYGCKITTDRGEIVIDYRNDSNGYYGGDLCWPGEHFYGGVFKQNMSKHNWQTI